ncbi:mitochondrial ribosomal protein s19-like protein [Xylariales sp. AK1849]|nr:mitochondrial ribosomal protein s19-like protein [Xylariales sp. AK1849]
MKLLNLRHLGCDHSQRSSIPDTMRPTGCLLKGRSVWKGPHIVPLPIVRPVPGEWVKPIRTQARSATILPSFVGLKFAVHNGKVYNEVTITEDMVGHKLGEFSMWVASCLHGEIQADNTLFRTRKPFIWTRG